MEQKTQDMKEILLTKGKKTIVDDVDYDMLSQFKWCYSPTGYAVRRAPLEAYALLYLHRVLLEAKDGEYIDHINGDRLDNRKDNLRKCSMSENLMNRGKQKNNSSGYKGVSLDKSRNKWQAQIQKNGKNISLGRFYTREDAARAYDKAAVEFHQEFSRINGV